MVDIHPGHARAVLHELAIGLILLDDRERVSWVNEYSSRLLNKEPEELLGRDIQDLPVPYEPVPETAETNVAADGSLISITQRYAHPIGGGSIITLLDRGHILVWFLSALSSGVPATVAASGILSRGATINRLEAEVSRSRRYANPLSCISISTGIDKPELIGQVAMTLKEQLRWVDLLGMWNDNVLLIVLPETAADAAQTLAMKLMHALSGAERKDFEELKIGHASWRRGDSAERMVARALKARQSILAIAMNPTG